MLQENFYFHNTPPEIQNILFDSCFKSVENRFDNNKKVVFRLIQETTNSKNFFFKVFVGEKKEKISQIIDKEADFMFFIDKNVLNTINNRNVS